MHSTFFKNVINSLPPIHYKQMHSGEIDYYGASYNIARSLGLSTTPWTRASWFHGWYQYEKLLPELIIQEDTTICCNPTDVPNLVPTVKLELFLQKITSSGQKQLVHRLFTLMNLLLKEFLGAY